MAAQKTSGGNWAQHEPLKGRTSRPAAYSARVIKAGALLPDTKILLAHWDEKCSVDANLARLLRENPFGKTSRSRLEDILAIFRQRYLISSDALSGLVHLARTLSSGKALDRILYFHAVQSDPLLRHVVVEHLWPLYVSGKRTVTVGALTDNLLALARKGKTRTQWREGTARRVAQGVLSLLRDCGILEGVVRKSIASPYLPVAALAYVAFLLTRPPWNLSGQKLVHAEEWRVFLLGPEAVETGLLEAHQARLVEFQAAGSIVRVQFPSDSVEAYARLLASRAH